MLLLKGIFTLFLGLTIGGCVGFAFALTSVMGNKIASTIVGVIAIAIIIAIATAIGLKVLFWSVLFGIFNGILCMALARAAS